MAIVTLTEALLQRLSATDGRILRDKILCGFCLKANKRSRTFLVATSVQGQQLRMTLGRWPLVSVDDARMLAIQVLRDCRSGQRPTRQIQAVFPTLRVAIQSYCEAKRLKQTTRFRYESILRTHFGDWMDRPVSALGEGAFTDNCHHFGKSSGGALVEVGRGVIGSLIKYLNAVHGLSLVTPFGKLAAAGLLPERSKPRVRRLQEAELPVWRVAVDKLPDKQRDFLLLVLFTGLRRSECAGLKCNTVNLIDGIITIPETKNGKVHTLPITDYMREILVRRCDGLGKDDSLFSGVSIDHLWNMAMRAGAPRFMLHDLRKILATAGERLRVGDATLRRILNHTAPKSDVLHKHYVSLNVSDVAEPLRLIQVSLIQMMGAIDSASSS